MAICAPTLNNGSEGRSHHEMYKCPNAPTHISMNVNTCSNMHDHKHNTFYRTGLADDSLVLFLDRHKFGILITTS